MTVDPDFKVVVFLEIKMVQDRATVTIEH